MFFQIGFETFSESINETDFNSWVSKTMSKQNWRYFLANYIIT